jgi:outer membrane protein assembly factor BamE (lipoprotein component of BamABCDE complex)
VSSSQSFRARHCACSLHHVCLVGLLLAVTTFAGCVILPVPTPPTGSEIVGDDAVSAIKPGITTRADVLLALGDPSESEETDRFFAYDWKVSYGAIVWAWGITYNVGGAGGNRLWAYRCLAIEFRTDTTVARTAYLHLESSEASGCLPRWHKQGAGGESQQ